MDYLAMWVALGFLATVALVFAIYSWLKSKCKKEEKTQDPEKLMPKIHKVKKQEPDIEVADRSATENEKNGIAEGILKGILSILIGANFYVVHTPRPRRY